MAQKWNCAIGSASDTLIVHPADKLSDHFVMEHSSGKMTIEYQEVEAELSLKGLEV
ncbi:hypothetical protein [Endozoicomonas sp. OPT23]|uniref:hypothetical protein n=1 Tax=Endozoicomonas sp. OPT23 TaxID=2072845 RepID=UPI00129B51BF|nr:hypothetical protein [Endozoicomonas sp. OPT23]